MKRIITIITLNFFIIYIVGCSKITNIPPEESRGEKIQYVMLLTGNLIEFDSKGGSVDISNQLIMGNTKKGEYVEILIEDVRYVQTKKFDWLKSSIIFGPLIFLDIFMILK